MKIYTLKTKHKTTRQALKCFNLVFLNMGYLGKLDISRYEKAVVVEKMPFKHNANKLINLIKSKKLRFEEMILTTTIKETKTEVLNGN